jgi:hypothetical protein
MEPSGNNPKQDLGDRIEQSITNLFSNSAKNPPLTEDNKELTKDEALAIAAAGQSMHQIDSANGLEDETNLKNVAGVILAGGIVSSTILFFTLSFVTIPGTEYTSAKSFFAGQES